MIADIFTAVAASPVLTSASPGPVVTSQLGDEWMNVNAAPNRMVWVPTRDSVKPGRIAAGLTQGGRPARATATRVAGVTVRIWSKATADNTGNLRDSVAEILALEHLVRRLLVAVHQLSFGDYHVDGVLWGNGDVDNAGGSIGAFGRFADVMLTFQIPIYMTDDEAGIVTTTTTSVQSTLDTVGAPDEDEIVITQPKP